MLRVGLTGGIGSGKSTVARRLESLGAVLIDADALAREVVSPGSSGLAEVTARFGAGVLAADGSLDRAALGAVVFTDAAARRDLERITHPRIEARTRELVRGAAHDAIVVHDVPLLVEKHLGPGYHLVVVVAASAEVRVSRLTGQRGMSEQDARSRIAAQADDEARRAAADVWLENEADVAALELGVDRLWSERLAPFRDNIASGSCSVRAEQLALSEPDRLWPQQAHRLLERISTALGERATSLEHIGSTSIEGLVAKDVLDLQVGVASLAAADEPAFVASMARAGLPRAPGEWADAARGEGGEAWPKRMHGNADPARVAHIHVRVTGSPGWRWALLVRDWLRADAAAREEYAALKLGLAAQVASSSAYAAAKEPWFAAIAGRAQDWARETGWEPPGG